MLTHVGAVVDCVDAGGLDATKAVAVSPDGNHVYVVAEYDDALTVFSRDSATQELTFVEDFYHTAGVTDGLNWPSDVIVSPDNAFVYVTGRSDSALAVFSRDPATGQLTSLEVLTDGAAGGDGLFGASSVDTSPDGCLRLRDGL